jgi:hypothetical protein
LDLWGYIKESITARSTLWTERTHRQKHSNSEYGFAMYEFTKVWIVTDYLPCFWRCTLGTVIINLYLFFLNSVLFDVKWTLEIWHL